MRVLIKTLSPIVHSSFGPSAGNATLFRRIACGDSAVPVVSGNALRGVMRRVVMRDLLDRCGLDVSSPGWDGLYAALANGGHLQGAEKSLDPRKVRDLRASVPALSLFGAALKTWMLSGRMTVGVCWPRCSETSGLGLVARGEYVDGEDLIEEISHVRHVDRDLQSPEISGVTPMPTTMECLQTGSVLESEILFRGDATEIERAIVPWSLARISELGGKSGSGMGRVSIEHDADPAAYESWLDSDDAVSGAKSALEDLAAQMLGGKKRAKAKA